VPSSLPDRLESALLTVAASLDGAGVAWAVSGSAALALRGFRVTPHDLDIEVVTEQIADATRALGWEAVVRVDAGGRSVGAAGTIDGAPVEVFGGFARAGENGVLPSDDPFVFLFVVTIPVGTRAVPVMPVEEYAVRAIVAGDAARLDRLTSGAPFGFAMDETYVALRLAAVTAAE
jgi:hypothetical protein